MTARFLAREIQVLHAYKGEIHPFIALFKHVGAALESRAILREAKEAETLIHIIEQAEAHMEKLGDLGEALRKRRRRGEDWLETPDVAKMKDEAEDLVVATEKLLAKAVNLSVDFTLSECIGPETGLAVRLAQIEPEDPIESIGELSDALDELLRSPGAAVYDFRRRPKSRRPKPLRRPSYRAQPHAIAV